ncbi:MAG: O-antigen ligase family protein [Crocinitomicaceae bacterium]|nr:O-antigen ligase family protein [Flavobacteriales bacterium]NQZ34538.1 O-antigen ligase family protein [Crocinitomicaceae bacterium]
MKTWERILHYLALLFVVLSLAGELLLPANVRFILDDLFFPFGVLFLAQTFFKYPKWRWFIFAFGAMTVWGMLSDVLANGTVRTAPIGMLLRWLKWPIMCIAIAELGHLKIKRNQVENGVVISFLVLAGINILMMINPFGVGRWLSEMYTPKIEMLLSNYHEFGAFRLSGTMLNPNTNAILFGLFLIFFLHMNARKYWKYILLAFILVFLTQSRTVMLMSLVIFALFVLSANTRKVNMIIVPAGILSLIVGLFLFRSTNLMSIFNGSAFQSNSWTQRMEHYGILFKGGFNNMLLGHGIVLDPIASVGFYFDSEYLSIGYQYGLIGLFIWVVIIGLLLRVSLKVDRKSTFAWALVLFVFGIAATNFTFLNVECATLMMALVGAWLFLQSDDKFNDHPQEEAK